MEASTLESTLRDRFRLLKVEAEKSGFKRISHGIVDHSDIYDVVGFEGELAEPKGHYDAVGLRIAFIASPHAIVTFKLQWSSWMADPAMVIRANYPPLIVKTIDVGTTATAEIQRQAERYVLLLARELKRGRPPGILEYLWIKMTK